MGDGFRRHEENHLARVLPLSEWMCNCLAVLSATAECHKLLLSLFCLCARPICKYIAILSVLMCVCVRVSVPCTILSHIIFKEQHCHFSLSLSNHFLFTFVFLDTNILQFVRSAFGVFGIFMLECTVRVRSPINSRYKRNYSAQRKLLRFHVPGASHRIITRNPVSMQIDVENHARWVCIITQIIPFSSRRM